MHTRTCLLAIALLASACAAGELADGLLLYMPFDGSAAPAFCTGRPDAKLGAGFMGQGRVAGGVNVIGTASVVVASPGNFYRPRGTVAFWHKPAWRPGDTSVANRMILKEGNFQITWYTPKQILFFMTGTTYIGRGFKWDYTVAATEPRQWKPGEWHHLAITWDSAAGAKQLFLDGRLAKEGKTEWMRKTESPLHATIALGSPAAQGAYDEWAIWNRVLSADEVARLAKQPEAAAKALAKAKMPEPEAKAPAEFKLVEYAKPEEAIVEPGEPKRVPCIARNLTGKPLALALRVSLVDAYDRVLKRWSRALDLKAKEEQRVAFEAVTRRFGAFKIRVEFDWQGATFRKDVGGFAVWPKAYCKPSPDSFFGLHVNSWYGGAFIRQAQRLGISWVRDHDMLQATWMKRVWPEPGEPQWTYDSQIAAWQATGASVLGTFFATPYWAADPPLPKPKAGRAYPGGSKPRLDVFEQYVRMVVRRYGHYIRVWEVWNEPTVSMFWKGTPEEFGRLAKVACRVAKEAAPTCKVIVGGFTGAYSREWYARAGRAGAFDLCDGISYHGYSRSLAELRRKHGMFRSLAKEFAPQGEAAELWDTEWGVYDTTFYVDADIPGLPSRRLLPKPSYLDGAARVVEMDALSMGLGVKRSFYYLHNCVSGPRAYHSGSSMEPTRAPKPKFMALVAMEYLTRGAKAPKLVEAGKRMALILSLGERKSLAVVWATGEGASPLKLPPGAEAFDLFGNPLSPTERQGALRVASPVYVRAALPAALLERWATAR